MRRQVRQILFIAIFAALGAVYASAAFATTYSGSTYNKLTTPPSGVNFSLLHRGPGTSGTTTHNYDPFQALQFDVDLGGDNTLNTGDTIVLDGSDIINLTQAAGSVGVGGSATLTLSGTLTVGGAFGSNPAAHNRFGDIVNLDYFIGGDLAFELVDGTGTYNGTFHMDAAQIGSSVFNGVTEEVSGEISVFLWGADTNATIWDNKYPLAIDMAFGGAPLTTPPSIPEPLTIATFGLGLIGIAGIRKYRTRTRRIR